MVSICLAGRGKEGNCFQGWLAGKQHLRTFNFSQNEKFGKKKQTTKKQKQHKNKQTVVQIRSHKT